MVSLSQVGDLLLFSGVTREHHKILQYNGAIWYGYHMAWGFPADYHILAECTLSQINQAGFVMAATDGSRAAAASVGLNPDTPAGVVADAMDDAGLPGGDAVRVGGWAPQSPASTRCIRAAQIMARAFGHEWGDADLSAIPPESLTVDAVEALCMSRHEGDDDMIGIIRPDAEIRLDGIHIHHLTAGSRVEWDICPTGITVAWNRPAGVYCTVSITDRGTEITGPADGVVAVYDRHITEVLIRLPAILATAAALGLVTAMTESEMETYIVEMLDLYRADEYLHLHHLADLADCEDDEAYLRLKANQFLNPFHFGL